MKKSLKLLGLIAMVAIIAFSMTACDEGGDWDGTLTIKVEPIDAQAAHLMTSEIGAYFTTKVKLVAEYDGSEQGFTYEWKKGGVPVAQTATYSPALEDDGVYTVTISHKDHDDPLVSASVTITKAPPYVNFLGKWTFDGSGLLEILTILPGSIRLDDRDGDYWVFTPDTTNGWVGLSAADIKYGYWGWRINGTFTEKVGNSYQFTSTAIALYATQDYVTLRRSNPSLDFSHADHVQVRNFVRK